MKNGKKVIWSLVVIACMNPSIDLSNNSTVPKEYIRHSGYNSNKLGSGYSESSISFFTRYHNYNTSINYNYLHNIVLFVDSIKDNTLKTISKLKKNWNKNNANPFKESLILKVDSVISKLTHKPFVAPTACGAIQLEYEKESGEYLEFEMYEEYINVFSINSDGTEEEQTIYYNSIETLYKLVKEFYA